MGKTVEVSDDTYKRVLGYVAEFGESFDMVVGRMCDAIDSVFGMQGPRLEVGSLPVSDAPMRTGAALAQAYAPHFVPDPGSPNGLRVPKLVKSDEHFRTSRGVFLPIGAALRGTFRGFMVHAVVTVHGIDYANIFYDNPSKAAVAAKMHMGADEKAAQTNGWSFWQIEYPAGSGDWQSLNLVRSLQTGTAQGEAE